MNTKRTLLQHQHRYGQRGFTLVELLVASLIGLILITGVIQFFLGSKQAYQMNDALSRIQENGRFALGILSASIRMFAYAGCQPLCPPIDASGDCTTSVNCQCLNNILNNGSGALTGNGTDNTVYWWEDFAADALVGYNGDGSTPTPTGFPAFGTTAGTRTAGTDAIIAIGGGGGYTVNLNTVSPNTGTPQSNTTELTLLQLNQFSGGTLGTGGLLLACSSQYTSLFQVTNVPTAAAPTIQHASGTSPAPGNSTGTTTFTPPPAPETATVLDYIPTAFYIGPSSSGIGNSLYQLQLQFGTPNCPANTSCMVPQEMVDGVENMQIFYGVGTSGVVTQYLRAANVTASQWLYNSDTQTGVLAVRIYLLLSSGDETNLFPTTQHETYIFPNDTDNVTQIGRLRTAPDTRAYQVLSTTIGIRNRLP